MFDERIVAKGFTVNTIVSVDRLKLFSNFLV